MDWASVLDVLAIDFRGASLPFNGLGRVIDGARMAADAVEFSVADCVLRNGAVMPRWEFNVRRGDVSAARK